MEAKDFVKESVRMFDSLRTKYKGFASCDGVSCNKCPMFDEIIGCISYAEKAIDIVEKWSKEHPIKTIMMDFFEKHPNANKRDDGRPCFCARGLGYKVECNDCRDCWNTPLEEVE